jgi:hypothetical protein
LTAKLKASPYELTVIGNDNLGDLWKTDARSMVVEPRVRAAGYLDFDPIPSLLVTDCMLGTFGLVYCLVSDIERLARQVIDQATYLRHLLLMDAGADSRPAHRAYGVECVLVLPDFQAELQLKELFRSTARDTAFWHAIGVNLLVCAPGDALSDSAIRRAFSWLLTATRAWFQEPAPPAPLRRLTQVKLENYRLPGKRTWTLEPAAAVHLLYGQNGTGKSSLSEALELSVTGAAVRLKAKSVADYGAVIRNRGAKEAASIELGFHDATQWKSAVTATGVAAPLDPKIPASSFRLDQDVMDELARKGSAQRADTFLGSYFPNDRGLRHARNEALGALDAIIRTLPPEVQSSFQSLAPDQKADAVLSRFAWVRATETRPPTVQELEVCRPVSAESLEGLRPLSADIEEFARHTQFLDAAEFERLFKGFNEALERVRGRAGTLIDSIITARQCLSEEPVRTWRPASQGGQAEQWLALLTGWSEQIALADLAEREWQVSQSLADAAKSGWLPDSELPGSVLLQAHEASRLDSLSQLRDRASNEERRLHEELVKSTPAAEIKTQAMARPHFSERQVRALNLAGETLARTESTGSLAVLPLGQLVDQAFTKNETPVFAGVTIGGTDSWADQLSGKLDIVQKALTNVRDESYVGPAKRREDLKTALDRSDDLRKASEGVKDLFLTELQNERLNAALNELIALFTPARWAYEDVTVTRGFAGGKDTLELELSSTNGGAADLMLNMAELNVFTLALHLLSAIRIENSLGILLFDDPLQNMDELTVTAVARGLAKIARVFPPGWQMVFLFHSEDDLERFRQEIPSAVYLLPWLAPSAGVEDDVPIARQPLKSSFDAQLQNLARVIQPLAQPAAAAAAP